MSMTASEGESGFTLIETIAALAVLALALGALYETFGTGFRAVARTDEDMQALEIARARLAESGSILPLQDGVREGVADGFRWRVETKRHERGLEIRAFETTADRDARLPRAYWVTATVSWRPIMWSSPRSLALTTAKLAGVSR